ncbi:uncharacterized protein N7496_002283 [Penicillium cataractarum]|uniref:Zn(2)-C6 fungal-type domain-containing protein n=1 Tax=Penicillium cataractarum TaxID=2100454 RepID=A0A9W9VHQ1_9EURO|nr:uncharacterized protein N7496_002283 [Penicillium cataractarum]KAJ5379855.1 hypothetical protein N7496_002283 [Penicillium cataractarum]
MNRKRKCDGHKPACRLCKVSGATCEYQDPTAATAVSAATENVASAPRDGTGSAQKRSGTTADMIRRLDDLEKLIREQRAAPAAAADDHCKSSQPKETTYQSENLETHADVSAFLSSLWIPPEISLLQPQQLGNDSSPGVADTQNLHWSPASGQQMGGSHTMEEEPLTIPIGHLTPTSSLFSLDQIKKLIGEYPEDFFYQIESTRNLEPKVPEDALNIDKDVSDSFLAAFFSEIHPHFPILNPTLFGEFFNGVLFDGAGNESSQALCLMVLALGKLASNRQACSPGQYTEDDGMEYFGRAYHRLTSQWITSYHFNLPLASGLVYCAIYLCYLERPLHAWRMVYMASSKVQMMASQAGNEPITQEEIDCLGRLCWTCFLLECDALAEFHLPRSGIEIMMENMPFPCFANGIDSDGLTFLAICSVRRLLNRIHRAIYATAPRPREIIGMGSNLATSYGIDSVGSLESICTELAHQLDSWYESLPVSIRFDLTETKPSNLHDGWLRLRYWSAKHIICRPCLVYAATLPDNTHLPSYIIQHSEICVSSCRNYIETATYVLRERTQYTWMTIQASLACAFVLTIASGSSLLRHLVPDITTLLGKVTTATQPWATTGSSAESIGWILKTITQKQKFSRRLSRGSLRSPGEL